MEFEAQATKNLPRVSFKDGILRIEGRSITFDSARHFSPLFEALYTYVGNPLDVTEVHINLEYINSDSTRTLLRILQIIEGIIAKTNKHVKIYWHYSSDDELMNELGQFFQEILQVPVELIEVFKN